MSATRSPQQQKPRESDGEHTDPAHTIETTPDATPSETFDTVIIHSDGSYHEDGDLSGTGFTLETNGGEVITERWDTAPAAETSMETEAVAALTAVREAKKFNPSYIILYSDCKPLVDRLDQEHPPSGDGTFYHEARTELAELEFTSISYIPRERNARADELAHRALRELRGDRPGQTL